MINKITKIIQITAIFTAVLVFMPAIVSAEAPSATDAPTVSDQGNGGVVSGAGSTPTVTDQGNGGVTSGSTPTVTDQGNGGVTSGSTPTVTDQGNGGVVSGGGAPSTTDQGNGGIVGSNPSTPPSTPDSGSTRSSGGSSRSGGRSGGRSDIIIDNTACLYLNDYLSINSRNSEMEVVKLQAFLLNSERLNVDINGKFDQKTFNAVKAFQTRYSSEILSPWGSNLATGKVFYTTKKKINELYCRSPFPLTATQQKEIDAYKNRVIVTSSNSKDVINKDSINSSTSTSSGSDSVDTNNTEVESNDSQAGVVIKAPLTTRVYNFIRWLFAF
jgi:hypothetical protein